MLRRAFFCMSVLYLGVTAGYDPAPWQWIPSVLSHWATSVTREKGFLWLHKMCLKGINDNLYVFAIFEKFNFCTSEWQHIWRFSVLLRQPCMRRSYFFWFVAVFPSPFSGFSPLKGLSHDCIFVTEYFFNLVDCMWPLLFLWANFVSFALNVFQLLSFCTS